MLQHGSRADSSTHSTKFSEHERRQHLIANSQLARKRVKTLLQGHLQQCYSEAHCTEHHLPQTRQPTLDAIDKVRVSWAVCSSNPHPRCCTTFLIIDLGNQEIEF
jgi:hypothetical protein